MPMLLGERRPRVSTNRKAMIHAVLSVEAEVANSWEDLVSRDELHVC